jgi:hypothetical protein
MCKCICVSVKETDAGKQMSAILFAQVDAGMVPRPKVGEINVCLDKRDKTGDHLGQISLLRNELLMERKRLAT